MKKLAVYSIDEQDMTLSRMPIRGTGIVQIDVDEAPRQAGDMFPIGNLPGNKQGFMGLAIWKLYKPAGQTLKSSVPLPADFIHVRRYLLVTVDGAFREIITDAPFMSWRNVKDTMEAMGVSGHKCRFIAAPFTTFTGEFYLGVVDLENCPYWDWPAQ